MRTRIKNMLAEHPAPQWFQLFFFILKYRVKLIQNRLICVSSHLGPILFVLVLHCFSVVLASTCPPSTFPTPTGRWGVSTRSRMFVRNASATLSSLFRIRIPMDPDQDTDPDLDLIASQFGDSYFFYTFRLPQMQLFRNAFVRFRYVCIWSPHQVPVPVPIESKFYSVLLF